MDHNSFIFYSHEGIYIYERQGMHFLKVADLMLYEPKASEEIKFRMLMEKKLRQFAQPGNYIGKEAQDIIQNLYKVAEVELRLLLPKLASRDFFEFLVFMHSQWGRLMNMAQEGN